MKEWARTTPHSSRWESDVQVSPITPVCFAPIPTVVCAPRKPTVGLAMIVKNESKVIRRCLESLAPHVSHWTIVDTGSTDDTEVCCYDVFERHGVEGRVHHRPWRNFSVGRNQALQLGREAGTDYLFMLDADEVMAVPEGWHWPILDLDGYYMQILLGDCKFRRMLVFKSDFPWEFEGAAHEHPEPRREGAKVGMFGDVIIHSYGDGGRAENPEEKFGGDIRMLEEEIAKNPSDPRNVYYLGQSLACAGRLQEAYETYIKRSKMAGGYEAETFCSLWHAARINELLRPKQTERVINEYLLAWERRPIRAEPLCDLARYLRMQERYISARLFAEKACATPMPFDDLFLDVGVYNWRALDEYSVNAFYTLGFEESVKACDNLLASKDLPSDQVERVKTNKAFGVKVLEDQKNGKV